MVSNNEAKITQLCFNKSLSARIALNIGYKIPGTYIIFSNFRATPIVIFA